MSTTLEPVAPDATDAGLHIAGDVTEADGPLTAAANVNIDGRVGRGAVIRAGGDVQVGGEAVEAAVVTCRGALRVPAGAIVGGRAAACRGIVCRVAGDANGTPTELSIGLDEPALDAAEKRAAQIESALAKAGEFDQRLAQLVRDQKTLTAAQKEHVSDLLFRTSEARKRTAMAIQQLKAQVDGIGADAKAECLVTEVLHAGVTVLCDGARTTIGTTIRGPITIFAVLDDDGVSLRATRASAARAHALPCTRSAVRLESLKDLLEKLEQG